MEATSALSAGVAAKALQFPDGAAEVSFHLYQCRTVHGPGWVVLLGEGRHSSDEVVQLCCDRGAGSYTHLTLPTICSVFMSGVASSRSNK